MLTTAKSNLFNYANKVFHYQEVGYPGVTFDAQSTEWLATYNNDFIEKAVTRTHDALVADTEAGKMGLGPNN